MKIIMNYNKLSPTLNNVEIEGLIAMFNEFYEDYLESNGHDCHPRRSDNGRYDFFYCDDRLWSSDDANGEPLLFNGLEVKGLGKRDNGDLTYMILARTDHETEYEEILCEFNKYNGQWYIMEEGKDTISGKLW